MILRVFQQAAGAHGEGATEVVERLPQVAKHPVGLTVVAMLPPDATGWTDFDLESSTTYGYRVRATGEFGPSDYAGPIEVFVAFDPPAIDAITPAEGPSTGGTDVVVTGSGFLPEARINGEVRDDLLGE